MYAWLSSAAEAFYTSQWGVSSRLAAVGFTSNGQIAGMFDRFVGTWGKMLASSAEAGLFCQLSGFLRWG